MPSAIGLRVYAITTHPRGTSKPSSFTDAELNIAPPAFVSNFMAAHANPVQNNEKERSWYFEPDEDDGAGNSTGVVHYGTFGFESNLVNIKSKKKQYRRKVDDMEVIPLFYEFWSPADRNYCLTSFQSFQGRSCIGMVMTKMRELYEQHNPGFVLDFRKLLPNDLKGSMYAASPVKKLRLIKRKMPGDIVDQYFDDSPPEAIDFEVVMSARRARSLGMLSSLFDKMKGTGKDRMASVITFQGIDFPEAVAEIRVGKKTRRVGVMGSNNEAGVIDVSDDTVKGEDGHPTFESMTKVSDEILRDFYAGIDGKLT